MKNSDFENILWVSGNDWKKDTSLHSIKRSKGGIPINVAGSFNTSKTLLIIDNLERTIKIEELCELDVGFKKGGQVLITSQLSDIANEFYLSMPEFSKEVAIQILGEDISNPSEECKEIVSVCSFSPLILSTIRSFIDKQIASRNELYIAVLSTPEDISVDDDLLIMNRILGKLDV